MKAGLNEIATMHSSHTSTASSSFLAPHLAQSKNSCSPDRSESRIFAGPHFTVEQGCVCVYVCVFQQVHCSLKVPTQVPLSFSSCLGPRKGLVFGANYALLPYVAGRLTINLATSLSP